MLPLRQDHVETVKSPGETRWANWLVWARGLPSRSGRSKVTTNRQLLVASITRARTVAELRDLPGSYAIFTKDEAVSYIGSGRPLPLHPLCGGLPPDIAWPFLERATAAEVMAVAT